MQFNIKYVADKRDANETFVGNNFSFYDKGHGSNIYMQVLRARIHLTSTCASLSSSHAYELVSINDYNTYIYAIRNFIYLHNHRSCVA